MEWQQWPSVAFSDRQQLPDRSGIYVVADANQFVWYVGQALNLQGRWLGRGHHGAFCITPRNVAIQIETTKTQLQSLGYGDFRSLPQFADAEN